MNKNFFIILICAIISSGIHLYLSSRAQSISAGQINESSICHINDRLNCDVALASEYSQFAGLHLSDLGFATNFIIALLAFTLISGLVEQAPRIILALVGFSGLSVLASLVMMLLSGLFLKVFCPFCLILYLLSFVIMIFMWPVFKKKFLLSSIKTLNFRFLSGLLLAWLITGILSHLIFINLSNTASSKQVVHVNFLDWLSAPIKNTSKAPLLKYGKKTENSIKVTEFADFLCPHCKNSYYTLKLLKSSHPNIYVEYYSFPLDQCQGHGVSCALTRGVHCAKQQQQGWEMHHLVFDNQKKFIPLSDHDKVIKTLEQISFHLPIQWDAWKNCIQSKTAMDIQEEQLQAGKQMNITGTPTLLINGKKVPQRYFIKTVQAIQKYLIKTRKNL